jgi:hypothetical protein
MPKVQQPAAKQRKPIDLLQTAVPQPNQSSTRNLLRFNLLLLFSVAAIWTVELWYMQHLSMPNQHSGGPRFDLWAPKIRFALDAFFAGTLVFLLPRPLLVVAWVVSYIASVGLIAYAHFFNASLSILTMLNGWREAVMMAGNMLEWLPKGPMMILTTTFLAKCVLLWCVGDGRISRTSRWRTGLICLLGYAMLFYATTWVSPLNKIANKQGVGRVGRIRGYLGPWAAELYYLNNPRLLAGAIARVSYKSDQLTPIEYPIAIRDHLVIIQAESLDYNLIGFNFNGREVTPFLNQLRNNGLFYKARAYHRLGSADADFTMLLGGPPATNVLNYSIPGFPYDNALPHFLASYGFTSRAFHGNYASFYRRRDAFVQMGFTELLFRRDLEAAYPVTLDDLGIKDADVFNISSLLLRQSTGRQCHFIITLTSHTPYQFVTPDETYPVPQPRNVVERYMNHAHYLDRCLRDYVTSLGANATVFIYGDHPTEVRDSTFSPCVETGIKYVPVFICDTSTDLAALQKTRSNNSGIATDGTFSMIDLSTFLRNRVTSTFQESTQKTSSLNESSK